MALAIPMCFCAGYQGVCLVDGGAMSLRLEGKIEVPYLEWEVAFTSRLGQNTRHGLAMQERLSAQQLASFASELQKQLSQNVIKSRPSYSAVPFGNVRLGSHVGFAEGGYHPFVIVTDKSIVKPQYQVRPGTSVRRSSKSWILELPPRAVKMKKTMKSGERKYVNTYILCQWRLRAKAEKVHSWKNINDLDAIYHKPLRECLKAAEERSKSPNA